MTLTSDHWDKRLDEAEPVGNPDSLTIAATPFAWCDPASIPQRQWIYGSSLLRGSLSLIVAPGAAGKTAFTVGMALALATGRALLGKTVRGGPKRVWLWNLEDSRDELNRAMMAAVSHWNAQQSDVVGTLFIDSGLDGDGLILASEDQGGFRLNYKIIDALTAALKNQHIDVVIIDPFVSSHQVPENDNVAIDAIAKAWAKIAVAANCAVLLVHHTAKMRGVEVSAEASRGASALTNAARSVVTLNRMSQEEATRFGIDGEERRRHFRVYDDKNNRAPPADQSDWYQLLSVSLPNGPDGADGDSLPVVVPWSPPDAFEGVTTVNLLAVQSAIAAGEWRKDPQARNWAGNAVAKVLALNLESKPDKSRINQLLKTWIDNGALAVERRKDVNGDFRPFIVVGVAAICE